MNPAAPNSISAKQIRDVLETFELAASDRICEQIRAYIELLLRWNKRISLTSIESPEEIVRSHFAESLLGIKTLGEMRGRLADVGTGAGFPGIPLRLYLEELQLTLIEPNAKKCVFLAEAIRTLELPGVEIIQRRYEDVRKQEPGFDFVTARALGQFTEFLEWAGTVLESQGHVMVWTGPDGEGELKRAKLWKWETSYVIPRSKHRLIVVGTR